MPAQTAAAVLTVSVPQGSPVTTMPSSVNIKLSNIQAQLADISSQVSTMQAEVNTLGTSQVAAVGMVLGTSTPTVTAPYLDANGWTVFTPSPGTGSCATGTYTGTCVVYVSSSQGNDATCAPVTAASTSFTPCKTLDQGVSLLRSGYPDWLLLKKGDTFMPDSNGNSFGVFSKSGESASEPMVISSYDPSQPGVVDPYVAGARPLIESSSNGGTVGAAFVTLNGAGGDYIAMVGLEFYNYTADPSNPNYNSSSWSDVSGVYLLNEMNWWLMEDCKFSFYGDDIAINIAFAPGVEYLANPSSVAPVENPTATFTLRRSIIADAYSNNAGIFSEGFYEDGMPNLVFQDNTFDHDGWNATVPGATATIFTRNIYIQANEPSISGTSNPTLLYTDNISTQSGSEGAHFRYGGVITDNLWAYDAEGFDVGCTTSQETYCIPIYSATVTNNVIQDSTDINNDAVNYPRGYGFIFYNSDGTGVQFTNNVISQYASGAPWGAAIDMDGETSGVVATNNVIYDWANAYSDQGTNDITSPNAVDLTGTNSEGYPDPNRTIATYDSAVLGGPGTFADFIAKADDQSKSIWNPALTADAVNNYIRAGFGIGSATPTPASNPAPTVSLTASPQSITSGTSATLTYASTNATSCSGAEGSASATATVGVTAPTPTPTSTPTPTPTPTSTPTPTTFAVGARVMTTASLNVRSSASTRGNRLCTEPKGSLGTIAGGPTTSGGYTWWNVTFDTGCSGYVVQTYLTLSTTPAPTPFSVGAQVMTTERLNVRSSVTTQGRASCTQQKGALGTVTGGPKTSQGYTWWDVNFNTGCDGWVVQNYLTGQLSFTDIQQELADITNQVSALRAQLNTLNQSQAAAAALAH